MLKIGNRYYLRLWLTPQREPLGLSPTDGTQPCHKAANEAISGGPETSHCDISPRGGLNNAKLRTSFLHSIIISDGRVEPFPLFVRVSQRWLL